MTDAPSVDLLVRSLGAGEAARYRETVLRRLDALAAEGRPATDERPFTDDRDAPVVVDRVG